MSHSFCSSRWSKRYSGTLLWLLCSAKLFSKREAVANKWTLHLNVTISCKMSQFLAPVASWRVFFPFILVVVINFIVISFIDSLVSPLLSWKLTLSLVAELTHFASLCNHEKYVLPVGRCNTWLVETPYPFCWNNPQPYAPLPRNSNNASFYNICPS